VPSDTTKLTVKYHPEDSKDAEEDHACIVIKIVLVVVVDPLLSEALGIQPLPRVGSLASVGAYKRPSRSPSTTSIVNPLVENPRKSPSTAQETVTVPLLVKVAHVEVRS
jgi:hypothetical protein